MLFGGVICFAGWVRFFLFFVASGALLIWKAGNAKANVKKCVGNFACITDGLHAKYAENGLFRAFGACFWRVFSVLHTHPPPLPWMAVTGHPLPNFFYFFCGLPFRLFFAVLCVSVYPPSVFLNFILSPVLKNRVFGHSFRV